MNKETIEQAALDYSIELVLEAQDSSEYFAFIHGAEWYKEQSATESIKFAKWIMRQKFGYLAGKSYKQLYELWQKSKNNADN